VPDSDRTELQEKNSELKEVLADQNADAERLTAATDAVMQIWQRVGQAMYDQAQATPDGSAAAADGSPDADGGETAGESEEDVVEGEIVDEGSAS
jgi:molecular chaperone DnaK